MSNITPTETETRLSFSKLHPNHQLAWDSTSLSALKRCPRYYYYSIVQGYTTRGENIHLRFGIEYGNALTIYHQRRAKGDEHPQAMLEAVRYLLTQTWDETLGRPWTSDEPTKNRETLLRSVIWHLDRFEEDVLQTVVLSSGKPAVELSFRIQLDTHSAITDEGYSLCGYLDRYVDTSGLKWITDYKSTKMALDEKYFAQYSPNNQVSQYAFAGNIIAPAPISGVVIDALQVGVTFSRFERSHIGRTPAQLEEWLHDSLHYIRQNETYVEANYWPMNDTACNQYNGCAFRAVCSLTPSLREAHLKTLYHRRTWDPLVVREI